MAVLAFYNDAQCNGLVTYIKRKCKTHDLTSFREERPTACRMCSARRIKRHKKNTMFRRFLQPGNMVFFIAFFTKIIVKNKVLKIASFAKTYCNCSMGCIFYNYQVVILSSWPGVCFLYVFSQDQQKSLFYAKPACPVWFSIAIACRDNIKR